MTRAGYVDVIGGAAGDMLLAALLDAGAPLATVQDAIDAVLPGRFRVGTQAVRRAGLHANLLWITKNDAHQPSRSFRDLLATVQMAALPEQIRARAQTVLTRLAEAEARVHAVALEDLQMHELGADDTLLDVVGVAAALDALSVEQLLVSSLPLAVGGTVGGPHGELPLPAPATLELLRGFPVRGAENGELVTPTAAAILAGIGTPSARMPAMTIERIGYGAGRRDDEVRPNVVRVILGELAADPRTDGLQRDLVVMETNLDDLSPELVADAAQALRSAGAFDVWITPVQMKKGRSGIVLSVLCEPDLEEPLRKVFFEATSTFGVRSYAVRRTELERRSVNVALNGGSVRVKVGLLAGRLVSAKPEHDDVANLARQAGRPVRAIYEEAISAVRSLHDRD